MKVILIWGEVEIADSTVDVKHLGGVYYGQGGEGLVCASFSQLQTPRIRIL